MKTLFKNWRQNTEVRIQSLQLQREASKKKIRRLRMDMQDIVQQATTADDIDKKILSLDFFARKGELASETERFQDLSNLIGRLQSMMAADEKRQRLNAVASLWESIDTHALVRERDELNVRRELLKEEVNCFAAFDDLADCEDCFQIDNEFVQLVNTAMCKKSEGITETLLEQMTESD